MRPSDQEAPCPRAEVNTEGAENPVEEADAQLRAAIVDVTRTQARRDEVLGRWAKAKADFIRCRTTRASAAAPLLEVGKLSLPQRAPWLADLLDELAAFPAALHDDQVDSVTQALSYLSQRSGSVADALFVGKRRRFPEPPCRGIERSRVTTSGPRSPDPAETRGSVQTVQEELRGFQRMESEKPFRKPEVCSCLRTA
jgi:hypothetical protein